MDSSTVMIDPKSIGDNSIEDCSMDSSFSVVGGVKPDDYAPSLNTAIEEIGNMYEQRTDIKKLKEMKERFKINIQLQDEDIDDIKDRVNARRNIDQQIENEIIVLKDLLKNNEGVNALLVESGRNALDSMRESQIVANDGETTLKRAMEIMQFAFPIFKSVWKKSQEVVKVDDNVMSEICKFEEARSECINAGLDIEKRKTKSKEFREHISKAIELGESDVKKMMDIRKKELSDKRLEQCEESKAEISSIVESESGEVDGWLVPCKEDKDLISKFQQEQIERHEEAEKNHKKLILRFGEKIRQNKEKQMELMRRLEELKDEENKLEEEQRFQNKVQDTAQKLHAEVMSDLTDRFDVLENIQKKANTARRVVELMSICGNMLTNSSHAVEKEYLNSLLDAEKTAKERLRDALAHNAVETRIKVEKSTINIDDCKESMRVYKDKWKKAAQLENDLNFKKNKELFEEFKQEMKKEKKIKEQSEKDLEELTKKLEKLEENLDVLGVSYQTLSDMYDTRMEELDEINNAKFSSMESSDDMTDDEDDKFDDAVA